MAKNSFEVRPFGKPSYTVECGTAAQGAQGHGGGDGGLMKAVCALFAGEQTEILTSIDASVDSHMMALAAEESRVSGGARINVPEFAAQWAK